MSQDRKKKIDAITWEEIVIEAISTITNGQADIPVSTEEMYRWIESTEYLTDYGRSSDPNWHKNSPSYRASLMLTWQKMVSSGKLLREQSGVYRLTHSVEETKSAQWDLMQEVDNQLLEPKRRLTQVMRIQRSQKLRDSLINYYKSRCQICDQNSPYLFPSNEAGLPHAEVHHVKGLSESFLAIQSGSLYGFRVNGLGNLVVLCPHHHSMMHYHYPQYEFDREGLRWQTTRGEMLQLKHITSPHADVIRKVGI